MVGLVGIGPTTLFHAIEAAETQVIDGKVVRSRHNRQNRPNRPPLTPNLTRNLWAVNWVVAGQFAIIFPAR
jgi:hypothetical protein